MIAILRESVCRESVCMAARSLRMAAPVRPDFGEAIDEERQFCGFG
jgi:hypothetical protein